MKDSFIFYRSFADAAKLLGANSRLKLYEHVIELALNYPEDETEAKRLCNEIETNLSRSPHIFAQFLLIKPQILANNKRYFDGCKGGRPKTNGFSNAEPNENENVNENINVNGSLAQSGQAQYQKNNFHYPKRRGYVDFYAEAEAREERRKEELRRIIRGEDEDD